tara:strand:- start:41 stop:373 length:333 start_codon:yes stop_codon:yes gene_type:complete
MRQIEIEMNDAVRNKIAWSKSNTLTTFDNTLEHCFIYLHGNHIATYKYADGSLTLLDGGWQSNTTKSRLNALLSAFTFNGLSVVQKNWNWFIRDNDFNKRPVPFVSGMTV